MNLTLNLTGLLDDAKCFDAKCVDFVRARRWPEGVRCCKCNSDSVLRNGYDDAQSHRQRYLCKYCGCRFDDLSGTVLE